MKPSISNFAGLATSVFDNGRRGNPRPGCDCEQCFGYCLIDGDEAMRCGLQIGAVGPARPDGTLDLDA